MIPVWARTDSPRRKIVKTATNSARITPNPFTTLLSTIVDVFFTRSFVYKSTVIIRMEQYHICGILERSFSLNAISKKGFSGSAEALYTIE
jgi:hypothetical protein